MKLHFDILLFAAFPYLFGGVHAADEVDEDAGPHQGCKLLLDDRQEPQHKLVGEAYQLVANSDYNVESEAGATAAACNNGQAGGYACNNVDLLSMIELSDLRPGGSTMANDIWGWSSSGREFAIIGLKEGTAFVEISDANNPVNLGFLSTKTSDSSWRDIKTYKNYALIVSEAGSHGMQVFDLNELLDASPNTSFSETTHYSGFGSAHNIFVNEDTDFAYAVGTDTCDGGLHIIAMNNPQNPTQAGCYSNDGYTHDVQCVVYDGPDTTYTGREICFASNEDTLTIIDVTNKNNIVQLAKKSYSGDRYTHQGWLTEDHTHFLFNDELDEYQSVTQKTRTHVFRVTDLTNPVYTGFHDGRTAAIDHNLYVLNDLVYQANYRAGLNVLKIVDIDTLDIEEAGYFDIYPNSDSSRFNGAWSNYPYFPSGVVVVSGIESGLFVLKYNGGSSPTPAPIAPPPTPQTPPPPTPQTTPLPTSTNPAPDTPPVQSPATWGIDRVDQRDLPLDNSYSVSGSGSGITAYIIDTGILTTHDEFKYIGSSQSRASWGINTSGDGQDTDCNGHGTHVAGTVGGLTYGVAKNVELVAVKVLSCSGSGSTAGVIQGVDWAAQHAQQNGKTATANMSLGGGASPSLDQAVRALHNGGVPTVVAAGNSNQDACTASPAREPAVITVGSTTNTDARSSFSNYGQCVDVFAPGSSITAAWIGNDSEVKTISGTSMASPHVCGAVALLLESGIDAESVDEEIENRATEGKVTNSGSGSPNLLLYTGVTGPTSPPTPAPPTPAPTPCISAGIKIEVTTDNYPAETGWTLTNDCQDAVQLSKSTGSYSETGKLYTEEACIPNAEYTFVISDSYGDGICCSYGDGSYKVTYKGEIVKEGGQFANSESTTFGTCSQDTPAPVAPTTAPITPTPAPIAPTLAPVAPTTAPVPSSPVMAPTDGPAIDEAIFIESFEITPYELGPSQRIRSGLSYEEGEYSARVKTTQNLKSGWHSIRNKGFVGMKVKFVVFAKNLEVDDGFKLYTKTNGNVWAVEEFNFDDNLVNNEWTELEVSVSVPANANKFRFKFKGNMNQNNDALYFDQVSLYGKI